jgi:hypothetical protein
VETKSASFKGYPKSSGVGQTSGSGGWVKKKCEQRQCNGIAMACQSFGPSQKNNEELAAEFIF